MIFMSYYYKNTFITEKYKEKNGIYNLYRHIRLLNRLGMFQILQILMVLFVSLNLYQKGTIFILMVKP